MDEAKPEKKNFQKETVAHNEKEKKFPREKSLKTTQQVPRFVYAYLTRLSVPYSIKLSIFYMVLWFFYAMKNKLNPM